MNIAHLASISSLAGAPLAQRSTSTDPAAEQSAQHQRQVDSVQRTEAAAGIGQTHEDQQSEDRDADGRRPWELEADRHPAEPTPTATDLPLLSRDPLGQLGNELDLLA